jgi:osmotically-inducible protein OsmY
MRSLRNKNSALSGDDNLGELSGECNRDDLLLREAILEHLYKHVEIDTSKIRVSVKDHFVSLTGTVDSEQSRATVTTLVENVNGVEDVVNFLELEKDLIL